jgi:hypothetical protein
VPDNLTHEETTMTVPYQPNPKVLVVQNNDGDVIDCMIVRDPDEMRRAVVATLEYQPDAEDWGRLEMGLAAGSADGSSCILLDPSNVPTKAEVDEAQDEDEDE